MIPKIKNRPAGVPVASGRASIAACPRMGRLYARETVHQKPFTPRPFTIRIPPGGRGRRLRTRYACRCLSAISTNSYLRVLKVFVRGPAKSGKAM